MTKMVKHCDVCAKGVVDTIKVVVGSKLYRVCSFSCKDVVVGNKGVDVGCGIIDCDEVRDVRMCSECSLFNTPFNCYVNKRDKGRELMFVAFGRRRVREG